MTSDPHESPAGNRADLEALSRETRVPVDLLRTLGGISDLRHARLFTREALRRALDAKLHAKALARQADKGRAVGVPLDDL